MQIHGYDITIRRGETFSLDYILQNRDGSPFIVPAKASNPYILFSIASTKYRQDGRYIKNIWFKIPENMRFYVTQPIAVTNFNFIPVSQDPDKHADVDTYAVYCAMENGNNVYKRYLNDEWQNYEFRVNKTFSKLDTMDLIGQNYVYSIDFVDGLSMLDYLTTRFEQLFPNEEVPTSKEEIYIKLLQHDNFVEDIDFERELAEITYDKPLISSAKLFVIDNINGGV